MPVLKKQVEAEFELTPKDAAVYFCEMNSKQQAEFFNEIAEIVKYEWGRPFEFQVREISSEGTLTDNARVIMKTIGEYWSKL
jgi:hypothetical protein